MEKENKEIGKENPEKNTSGMRDLGQEKKDTAPAEAGRAEGSDGPLIPIIIPAYEPDERLISLLVHFRDSGMRHIVLVNDGSGKEYDPLFDRAERMIRDLDGVLLAHDVNRGKGRALKTGFSYVLEHYPEAIGTVTADSDGQHTVDCIRSVMDRLEQRPDALVLGVRSFDGEDVPWKSAFGNRLTMRILGYVSGVHVTDTQTGLRGIPRDFMKELLDVPGERFEFETRMLLVTADRRAVEEVPIRTIYDSRDNHQTHFDPLRDSIRIYRILGARFAKFMFASLSSCLIDLVLFALFCALLRGRQLPLPYVAVSTVLARILSATYNFTMNYRVVFKSSTGVSGSAVKYVLLAIVQMTLSALFVTGGTSLLPMLPEVAVKVVVDTILFLASYHVQRKYVF